MKTYNVCRYFDDVFEAIIKSFNNYNDAFSYAKELNDRQIRAYVEYLVCEVNI